MGKVLIVEDNPDVRAIFRTLLEREGFDVAEVGDALSMRKTLQLDDIDVVVIDVGLPGGENGLALAAEVAGSGLAVILVTGHPEHFEAVEKSGHPYLFKPFRVEALLGIINHLLREIQARSNAAKR